MVSGEELRELMRRFPAGVAIVGVDLDGERLGLTIGTLIPLSLEPPLVGFAVRREAALHELLRRSGSFGFSLLAAGQEAGNSEPEAVHTRVIMALPAEDK